MYINCGIRGFVLSGGIAVFALACTETPQADLDIAEKQDAIRVDEPCILGDESVWISGRTVIQGDVRSNGTITLEAGSTDNPTTVNGSVLAVGDIRLNSGSLVTGDAMSNTKVSFQLTAEVDGEVRAPEIEFPNEPPQTGVDPKLPEWPLPEVSVSSSGPSQAFGQWLGNCGTVLRSDNNYGNLEVYSDCSVILEAGSYEFNSIRLYPNAVLQISEQGRVEIETQSSVDFYTWSRVEGTDDPADLKIFSMGDVTIHDEVDFTGTIIAPESNVWINGGSEPFHGCVSGKQVRFNPGVSHDASAVYTEQESLTRKPVTMDDTQVTSWVYAESPNHRAEQSDHTHLDRDLLNSGPITVSTCPLHFPPCVSGFPNTPTAAGNSVLPPDKQLESCYSATDPGKVLDIYKAFYNVALIVDQINKAGTELQLLLLNPYSPFNPAAEIVHQSTDCTSKNANGICTTDLHDNPEVNHFGNIHIELVVNDHEGSPYEGASGNAIHWDGTEWKTSPRSGIVEYAILQIPLDAGYMAMNETDTVLDVQKTPGLGVLYHELGHILGFTEQYLRRYPWADLLGPTGTAGLYDVAEERNGMVTAYADWYLNQVYEARADGTDGLPGSGYPPVVTNPWRMHDIMIHRDPTTWIRNSQDLTAFATHNPKHLRWDSSDGRFVDCHTGRAPVYTMQFSEVGADAADDVYAQWIVEDQDGNTVLKETQQLNETSDGGTFIGNVSQWAQWEWNKSLSIPDVTGFGLPGVTGHKAFVTIKALITDDPATSVSPDHDNLQVMTAKLYAEDTTDVACVPEVITNTSASDSELFGTSIARTWDSASDPLDPVSRWVAVGAPGRDDSGVQGVGSVVVYKVDNLKMPSGAAQPHVVLPGPSLGTPQAFLRFGHSVALRRMYGTWDDILFVGAPGYDAVDAGNNVVRYDQGAVFIYKYNASTSVWEPMGLLEPVDGVENGAFGFSLTTGRNNRLIVGAPGQLPRTTGTSAPTNSKVYVYGIGVDSSTNTVTWSQQFVRQRSFDERFGWDVEENNRNLVVGAPAPHDNNSSGKAYLYRFEIDSTGSWDMVLMTDPSDPQRPGPFEADGPRLPEAEIVDIDYPPLTYNHVKEAGDHFGASVSIQGDMVAVGAPRHGYDARGMNFKEEAGAVYLFKFQRNGKKDPSDDKWFWAAKLVPDASDRYARDHFGRTVQITQHFRAEGRYNRTVAVGAPYHDFDRYGNNYLYNAGAVFVYDFLTNGDLKDPLKIDADGLSGVSRQESGHFGLGMDGMFGDPWAPGDMKTDFWHELFVGAPGQDAVGRYIWGTVPNSGVATTGSGGDASLAVDGDSSTSWLTYGFPTTIQVDLGENKSVSGLELAMVTGRAYDIIIRLKGEGENDTSWTPSYTGAAGSGSISFAPSEARYIEVEFFNCAAGCSGINDVSVAELTPVFRTFW